MLLISTIGGLRTKCDSWQVRGEVGPEQDRAEQGAKFKNGRSIIQEEITADLRPSTVDTNDAPGEEAVRVDVLDPGEVVPDLLDTCEDGGGSRRGCEERKSGAHHDA